MDIATLCGMIRLQPEAVSKVLHFAKDFDFQTIEPQLEALRDYKRMRMVHLELANRLEQDADGMKMLACMLYASARIYDAYKSRGIRDRIYVATMQCYTRFLWETHRITGCYCFDRSFWTGRQAGFHLFRLGELEYEIKPLDSETVISIHIPSDAKFTPENVEASLQSAQEFFPKLDTALADCQYVCHSWLMDPSLKEMLGKDSNILQFQNRFRITDPGEISTEVIGWVFQSRETDHRKLPERTTLQRNMKQYLLSGGVIRNAYGQLLRQ